MISGPLRHFKKSKYFSVDTLTKGEVVISTTTYIKKKLYTKHVLGHLEALKNYLKSLV